MNWFRSLPQYRQRYYALLVGAILLTLPCYCTGLLLFIMSPSQPTPTQPPWTPTPLQAASATLLPAALTLTAFPTQIPSASPSPEPRPGATQTQALTEVAPAQPTTTLRPPPSDTPPATEAPSAFDASARWDVFSVSDRAVEAMAVTWRLLTRPDLVEELVAAAEQGKTRIDLVRHLHELSRGVRLRE